MIAPLLIATLLVGLDAQVTLDESPPVTGQLLLVGPERVMLLTDDGQRKEFDPRTIKQIVATASTADASALPLEVQLRDGSRIACRSIASAGDSLNTTIGESTTTLPRSALQQAQLLPLPDGADETWQSILSNKHNADVVIVSTRDGDLRGVEGVIGEIDDARVKFQFDGEWIDVRREKVVGLIWYSAAASELKTSVCRLSTVNGSRLEVHQLEVSAGEQGLKQLNIMTATGSSLRLPINVVTRLDFASANLIYLSELDPERTEQTEYLFFEFPQLAEYDRQLFGLRRDATVSNTQLATDNQGQRTVYKRGVGIHSDATVVYRLAGEYRRFMAAATVDAVAIGTRQIELVVRLDGREVARHDLRSDLNPQRLDINLTGANRLEFEVLRGSDSNVGDHLSLCDARLMK